MDDCISSRPSSINIISLSQVSERYWAGLNLRLWSLTSTRKTVILCFHLQTELYPLKINGMVWSTSSLYGKKEPDKDEPEQKATQFLTKNRNEAILAVRKSLLRKGFGAYSNTEWNGRESPATAFHKAQWQQFVGKHLWWQWLPEERREKRTKERRNGGREEGSAREYLILSNKTSFNTFQNKPVANV